MYFDEQIVVAGDGFRGILIDQNLGTAIVGHPYCLHLVLS